MRLPFGFSLIISQRTKFLILNSSAKDARLMDQVREVLRFHHYALNTEKSYVSWILQYIRFHHKKQPKEMGKFEIELKLPA